MKIEAKILAALVTHCSTDTTRPHMAAVHVEWTEGGTVLAATDGHRLAVVRRGAATGKTVAERLYPADQVKLAAQAAGRKGLVRLDESAIVAEAQGKPGMPFVLRRLDDIFPPWRNVVPSWLAAPEPAAEPAAPEPAAAEPAGKGGKGKGGKGRGKRGASEDHAREEARKAALANVPDARERSSAHRWACNPAYLAEACELLRECGAGAAFVHAPDDDLAPFVVTGQNGQAFVVIMPMRC